MTYQLSPESSNYDNLLSETVEMFKQSLEEAQKLYPDEQVPKNAQFHSISPLKVEFYRSDYRADLYNSAVGAPNETALIYFAVGELNITFLDELINDLERKGIGQILPSESMDASIPEGGKITLVHKP